MRIFVSFIMISSLSQQIKCTYFHYLNCNVCVILLVFVLLDSEMTYLYLSEFVTVTPQHLYKKQVSSRYKEKIVQVLYIVRLCATKMFLRAKMEQEEWGLLWKSGQRANSFNISKRLGDRVWQLSPCSLPLLLVWLSCFQGWGFCGSKNKFVLTESTYKTELKAFYRREKSFFHSRYLILKFKI